MPISILVTNSPPRSTTNVPHELLELFHTFSLHQWGKPEDPFEHQAEVFRLVGREDGEVFLVAGTAAGKTLAMAVPLLLKLKEGRIRKVMWMYPTVALLEDQRRVIDVLAQINGLEVGQLQGGMSRVELIAALNRPIILATPDEVYWFFRKNVKYSGLLIYGLALVDEFVLDEAHLFGGLVLRNLFHLKRRVQLLGEKLGKRARWHVLTATPTQELKALTHDLEVRGRSKCGDVEITFLEPARDYEGREERLINAMEAALAEGAQKVLLVFNSADLAHRVFERIRAKTPPDLPGDLKWRFGRIPWGRFKSWLEEERVEAETVEEIEQWLKRKGAFFLEDLGEGTQTKLSAEKLAAKVAGLLESQVWALKRLAYAAVQYEGRGPIEAIERKLGGRGRLARLLWDGVKPRLRGTSDPESVMGVLDAWASEVQAALERIWTEDFLTVTAPVFSEITTALREAGMTSELAARVTDHLRYSMEAPEEARAGLRMSTKELAERTVALSWLEWLVGDGSRREVLAGQIQRALEQGQLEVEARHIAAWSDSRVPVVIYTGKMSRGERKGLIEAFGVLPRAVLISTPAVEVGVDFAADTLITEQCDGNSFLQRFGRVGRRPGMRGKVVVLVKNGETYVKLYQLHRRQVTREEFSNLIADPEDGLFPIRVYAEGSDFLDATHCLVNAQLGQIGGWLNRAMFGEGEITRLAQELREVGLPFAYGLRGTLPELSLRGDGGGDPFYVLRKVHNERLMSTGSPFEIARADMGYLEFLWRKSTWRVVVDTQATLEASQALFWRQEGRWDLQTGYGIAADYVKFFSDAPVSKGLSLRTILKVQEDRIRHDLIAFLAELRPHAAKALPSLLLRLGEALPLFFTAYARFILGQGDVYLQRVDQEGNAEAVEDRLGNPLVLPDQLWLILYGYSREDAQSLLLSMLALDLEEVVYDWETLEIQGSRIIGPVLLDRVAGACFNIYRRLVEHAGG